MTQDVRTARGAVPRPTELLRGARSCMAAWRKNQPPLSPFAFQNPDRHAIWGGTAGFCAAMRKAGVPAPDLEERAYRDAWAQRADLGNGLFAGIGGIAWAAHDAEHEVTDDLVAELERRYAGTALNGSAIAGHLYNGCAGDLLALFLIGGDHSPTARETGRAGLRQLAERLLDGDVPQPARPGQAVGASGTAVALALAGRDDGDQSLLDAARVAIDLDLAGCDYNGTENALQAKDGRRFMAYLGWGSGGVAVAAHLLSQIDPTYVADTVIEDIGRAFTSSVYVCGGLMTGRSGIGLMYNYLPAHLMSGDYAHQVAQHRTSLQVHVAEGRLGQYVVGEQNMKISYDFAHGGAGVALAVAYTPGDPAPWLPFQFTRLPGHVVQVRD